MQQSIQDQLKRYIQERSPESYLKLREAIKASPEYVPYSGSYAEIARPMLEQGKYREVISYLQSMMPNWMLNPGIHKLLSFAYSKLGKNDAARSEYALASRLLEGILSTGDGSEERPYLVLHTTDEYDVLEHLGKESAGQSLVEKGDKRYDRQTCQDGFEIWFDITTPYSYLEKRLTSQSRQ